MNIKHCQSFRKTKNYMLRPFEPKFKYIYLYIIEACPKCHQTVMEWQGLNHDNQHTPIHRIKNRDQEKWRNRIKTDLVTGERNHPGMSDATHEIKKDVAITWLSNLRRYGQEAIPKRRVLV